MSKNLRINLVIGINDFLVGGAQKLIVDQLRFIDKSIFNVTLVTLFEFPHKSTFYKELPSDINCVRLNFKSFYNLGSWLTLFRTLKTLKPDIVCSHLFFSNTVFRIFKVLLGYKIITVEHNTYFNKRKYEILVDKILAYVTFKIIAVSCSVEEFAARQIGARKAKFEVVYNGIDFAPLNKIKNGFSRTDLRKKLGYKENEIIFINNGRLTHQKNQQLLIAAFNIFHSNHPDSKLIIIGEGSLLESLQAQARSTSASSAIVFLGVVSHDVALENMYAGDFMVSTSIMEGLSIAYLEAQALGLPLLTTKTAGTDELLRQGKNGLFLEFDEDKIASTLELAISMDINIMRENSMKEAKSFDIKFNIKKYEELFLMALKK